MKNIKYFVENTFLTIISIVKFLRYGKFKYSGVSPQRGIKKVIILGNGPSLKINLENDIKILSEMDTFAVNKFCLTPEFYIVKPKYYLLLDTAFFMTKNSSLKFLELQKNIFDSFIKIENWEMTLFLPSQTDMKDTWDKLRMTNKNITIKYINSNMASGFRPIIFTAYRYNLAMPITRNVLAGAIFLSLNMGYENIYLIGADHSWTEDIRVNDKNQLYINSKHYYGEEHTIYYKGIEQNSIWKMHEVLFAWSQTFMSYFILKDYAASLKSSIYNLTPNSYIDAFSKIKLKEILK